MSCHGTAPAAELVQFRRFLGFFPFLVEVLLQVPALSPCSRGKVMVHVFCTVELLAGSEVQGTVSSSDCAGQCKLSRWLWQLVGEGGGGGGDAAWLSAEPGNGSPGFWRHFQLPSWRRSVVKYPHFIFQTPMAVWFHHGLPEGEGIVDDEEVGYILVVIG